LLVVWGLWWFNSLRRDKFVSGHYTWFGQIPYLGGDFIYHIDRPSRIWVAGGDAYAPVPGNETLRCAYPPLVLRLFAWTSLLSPSTAKVIWIVTLGLMAGAGALSARRTREKLGLDVVPATLCLAAFLFSTPILFEIERGQCNMLVMFFVMIALYFMRSDKIISCSIAGILLALAMWTKLYPGLLLVGVIALRRWRVLPSFLVTGGAIGLLDRELFARAMANMRFLVPYTIPSKKGFYVDTHSLSSSWAVLLEGTKLGWLGRIPGTIASVALLSPFLLWISYRVYRCPDRSRLAFPYLMWLLALSTFIPAVAVDYNLLFLPLAALAVWDRRDPVIVHLAMGWLLLWWQPIGLPIDGRMMLVFKLVGLASVAVSLHCRARELTLATPQRSRILTGGHLARVTSAERV
jgi:hypothetical protein